MTKWRHPEPLDINSLIFLDFTSYCIYNMIALSPLKFFHPQSCAKKTFVIVEIYYSSSFGGLVKWVKICRNRSNNLIITGSMQHDQNSHCQCFRWSVNNCQPHLAISWFCMNFLSPSAIHDIYAYRFCSCLTVLLLFVLPPLAAPQFVVQAWHKLLASQIANVLEATLPTDGTDFGSLFLHTALGRPSSRRRPSSAPTAVAVSYCNGALSQGGGFAAKVWRAWLDTDVALGKNPRMQWPSTLACRMTDLEGGWVPHTSWSKISPRMEPSYGAAGNAAWQQAPPFLIYWTWPLTHGGPQKSWASVQWSVVQVLVCCAGCCATCFFVIQKLATNHGSLEFSGLRQPHTISRFQHPEEKSVEEENSRGNTHGRKFAGFL